MPDTKKNQQNMFVEKVMNRNELKGAGKKRMIKYLAEKYDWDEQKVQFKLKRAILAEKYAQSH